MLPTPGRSSSLKLDVKMDQNCSIWPHVFTAYLNSTTQIKTFIQHYCRNYNVNLTLFSPPFKLLLAKHCLTASRHNISICASCEQMTGSLSELFTVFGLHHVLKETFGPSDHFAMFTCYQISLIEPTIIHQPSDLKHQKAKNELLSQVHHYTELL